MFYRAGRFLGYYSFWLFAWEPKFPERFANGIRDGFGYAWNKYNLSSGGGSRGDK